MGAEIRELPENTGDLATLRNLEIQVKGRSRSLKTEPYTTYSSYLTLNIIVTLKCGLEVTQDH